MQNIDLAVLLGPLVYVGLSAGLITYWKYRRRFTAAVLFLSAVAYFAAIGLKILFQNFTYGWINSTFGAASLATGLYFGLQTSLFEIGLAYAVARIAVHRGMTNARDAEGYGIGLAFWENGILLGALSFFNLTVTFLIIANGLMPQAEYQSLVNAEPSLFYSPSAILFPTALGILERISSLLVHFSWGYLCILSAYLRKRNYLLLAFPMGLIDALVPFASQVPLWVFEASLFLISLGILTLTWKVTEKERRGHPKELTAAVSTAEV